MVYHGLRGTASYLLDGCIRSNGMLGKHIVDAPTCRYRSCLRSHCGFLYLDGASAADSGTLYTAEAYNKSERNCRRQLIGRSDAGMRENYDFIAAPSMDLQGTDVCHSRGLPSPANHFPVSPP